MTRPTTLCTGYIALDLVSYNGGLAQRAGGTAGNVAANLAFLGWRSTVVGNIGNDAAGRRLVTNLNEVGVTTTGLRRAKTGTPVVLHEVLSSGHRFSFKCPACGRRFPRFHPLTKDQAQETLETTKAPDVFFFDRASASTALLAEGFRKQGSLVIFEPSRPGRTVERCVQAAHVVKYSSDRANTIGNVLGGAVAGLRIVTEGSRGVQAYFRGKSFHVPGFSVAVVDAGGAGDWTTAGFLWSLPGLDVENWTIEGLTEALEHGQALAAVSCTYPGARAVVEHLTRTQLINASNRLIQDRWFANSTVQLQTKHSARRNACDACLAPV